MHNFANKFNKENFNTKITNLIQRNWDEFNKQKMN